MPDLLLRELQERRGNKGGRMKTCESCKYWSDCQYDFQIPHRACLNPKLAESNKKNDELGYPYDEGGCITTGKDFGCIHHTEV